MVAPGGVAIGTFQSLTDNTDTVLKVKPRQPWARGSAARGSADDGVRDQKQLVHGRDGGHLPGLAPLAQAGMEITDGGVVAGGGHGGYAGDGAHGGATTPDMALAAVAATVAVQGGMPAKTAISCPLRLPRSGNLGDEHGTAAHAQPAPVAGPPAGRRSTLTSVSSTGRTGAVLEVTEHWAHAVCCPSCRTRTRVGLPRGRGGTGAVRSPLGGAGGLPTPCPTPADGTVADPAEGAERGGPVDGHDQGPLPLRGRPAGAGGRAPAGAGPGRSGGVHE